MTKQFTITLLSDQEPFPVEAENGKDVPKNLKVIKEEFTLKFDGNQNIEKVAGIVAKALWGNDKIYKLNYKPTYENE